MSLPRGLSEQSVRLQLDRILRSKTFSSARQLQQLLLYVVERCLTGKPSEMKEYIIGTQVFGRSDSYDTRTDPIVRVQARRLREKLDRYYELEGKSDPIVIEIPKGSYTSIVSMRSSGAIAFAGRTHPQAVAPCPVVAVLPFVVLGLDRKHDDVGDELTEAVIDALVGDDIQVVCRTSVYQYKNRTEDVREIGKHLNSDRVVEGSVRILDDQLRIKVRLVGTSDGLTLWAQTFAVERIDESLDQSGVAGTILEALKPLLKGSRGEVKCASVL